MRDEKPQGIGARLRHLRDDRACCAGPIRDRTDLRRMRLGTGQQGKGRQDSLSLEAASDKEAPLCPSRPQGQDVVRNWAIQITVQQGAKKYFRFLKPLKILGQIDFRGVWRCAATPLLPRNSEGACEGESLSAPSPSGFDL